VKRLILAAALASTLAIPLAGVTAAAGEPTCSDLFGYPHGYHIMADYVSGIGSEFLGGPGIDWPPTDVNGAGGAALAGGPGPAFHFENGVAPGASFCNDSNSPGAHL
jgi:hypothetical protein